LDEVLAVTVPEHAAAHTPPAPVAQAQDTVLDRFVTEHPGSRWRLTSGPG
jgi:hypothetical protein